MHNVMPQSYQPAHRTNDSFGSSNPELAKQIDQYQSFITEGDTEGTMRSNSTKNNRKVEMGDKFKQAYIEAYVARKPNKAMKLSYKEFVS